MAELILQKVYFVRGLLMGRKVDEERSREESEYEGVSKQFSQILGDQVGTEERYSILYVDQVVLYGNETEVLSESLRNGCRSRVAEQGQWEDRERS